MNQQGRRASTPVTRAREELHDHGAWLHVGTDHLLLMPVNACGAGSWVASHVVGPPGPTGLDAWLQRLLSDDPAWPARMERARLGDRGRPRDDGTLAP